MAYKLLVLLAIALLTSPSTNAGEKPLTWAPPTFNTDGSPLVDLASYEIYSGCDVTGVYDRPVETIAVPANSYVVLGLPDTGTCYFVVRAVNSNGASSDFSNEVSKFMGPVILPGSVDDTQISWQESAGAPMAISRTALESGFDTVDGTVFTTASFTPSANKLVLVYISGRPSGVTGTVSLSGNGLTWELVVGEETGVRYSAIWRSMGASPSAGALTITFTDEMRNATWEISEFSDIDISGSNGSGAIVQSDRTSAASVTSIAPTLASFADATNNATYAGATHRVSEAQNPETGFTELSEQQTGEAHAASAMFKVGEDLSPTIDWATSANAVAAACEIKTAGTPVSNTAIVGFEALQGILKASIVPIEADSSILQSYQVPFEALQSLSQTYQVTLEALQGVSQTKQLVIESPQGVLLAAIVPVEALSTVAVTPQVPIEALASIIQARQVPFEALTSISQTRQAVIEALQTILKAPIVPFEALGQIAVSNTMIVAIEALLSISRSSVLVIEAIKSVDQSYLPGVEALQSISQSPVLVAEALGRVITTPVIPIEAPQGVISSVSLDIEALGIITRVSQLIIEVIAQVSASSVAQLEAIESVAAIATLTEEALAAIALAVNVPLEALASSIIITNIVDRTVFFQVLLSKDAKLQVVLNKDMEFS